MLHKLHNIVYYLVAEKMFTLRGTVVFQIFGYQLRNIADRR